MTHILIVILAGFLVVMTPPAGQKAWSILHSTAVKTAPANLLEPQPWLMM